MEMVSLRPSANWLWPVFTGKATFSVLKWVRQALMSKTAARHQAMIKVYTGFIFKVCETRANNNGEFFTQEDQLVSKLPQVVFCTARSKPEEPAFFASGFSIRAKDTELVDGLFAGATLMVCPLR